MKFGKRIASVLLCTCMVVGAFYAAVTHTETTEFTPHIGKDSVVVWYTDENMTDYISAMAVSFHEEYDIRVIPQLHSGLDYLESIYDASVQEEKGPDVFIISSSPPSELRFLHKYGALFCRCSK